MGELSDHDRAMLKHVPMFSALSDEQLDTLAAQSSRVQFGPHEIICRQGEEALFFFAILTGHVRLSLTEPDGSCSDVRILGPGQAFGESDALRGQPTSRDAEAMDDVLLLAVQGDSFNSILRSHVEVVSDLVAGLASRLQDLARLADDLARASHQRQVAAVLLACADEADSETFSLADQRDRLARRAHVEAELFDSILAELQRRALIVVDDATVRILNRAALEALATGADEPEAG
jgi:CRP-like cAMP-binding protein